MASATSGRDDLHGNAPDECRVGLLIVDVINDLEFPDNEYLIGRSSKLTENILRLKRRCRAAGIPVVYANDNKGRWRSDMRHVVETCGREGAAGQEMVRRLAPQAEDYVVLKPKHSAFYATPLEVLLEHMGVKSLIIAGITTDSCVLQTVSDAYVRDLQIYVPEDCSAGLSAEEERRGLEVLRKSFAANTTKIGRIGHGESDRGRKQKNAENIRKR